MRYPPDGVRGLALSTRGAGLGGLGHGDVPRDQRPDPRDHPDRVAERGRARGGDRRASTASTSCSSVRPTCRTASASPVGSTTRRYLDALRRGHRRGRGAPARPPASCSTTPAVIARHRDLGFRFIGLGADGAFVASGARAMLAAARGLTVAVARPATPSRLSPRPRPRAASPARARRAVAATSGRSRRRRGSAPHRRAGSARGAGRGRRTTRTTMIQRLDRADQRGLRRADRGARRRRTSGSRGTTRGTRSPRDPARQPSGCCPA